MFESHFVKNAKDRFCNFEARLFFKPVLESFDQVYLVFHCTIVWNGKYTLITDARDN